MTTISAISFLVIKELYRRKDFYVLFILTALVTLVMGSVTFFNDPKIARYLKEICLLLIWISALVISITTAARQIPAERENRTIFPLLAKPVTRAHVVVGKFLGCWLAAGLALLVFYTFFGTVSGAREHHWPFLQYLQVMWLHWMMLGVVIALAILGSVVFAASSSNSTICFLVVIGILLLGRHLNKVALQQPEPLSTVVYSIYFLIPHLEWYDLRDFVVYGQKLVGLADVVLVSVYAMVYAAVLLFATWIVFRRKALHL